MVTNPDTQVAGVMVTTPSMNKWTTSIQEIQAWGTLPWTNLTLVSGWGAPFTGAQLPRLRRFAGKVEFSGHAYNGSAFSAGGGVQLSAANAAIAAAIGSSAGSFAHIPIMGSQSSGTIPVWGVALNILADGRIFVNTQYSSANLCIMLSGAIDDLSVG